MKTLMTLTLISILSNVSYAGIYGSDDHAKANIGSVQCEQMAKKETGSTEPAVKEAPKGSSASSM